MRADGEREPIEPGQRDCSPRFVLAVSDDWIITRASANLYRCLHVRASAAIGMLLDRIIVGPAMDHLRYRIAKAGTGSRIDRIFGLHLQPGGERHDLACYASGHLLIVEGERSASRESRSGAMHELRISD